MPNAQPAAAAPREEGGQNLPMQVVKSLGIFLAMQAVTKYGMKYAGIGQTPPTAAPDTDAGTAAGAADGAAAAPAAQSAGATQPPAITAVPYWPLGTPMSMLLYVSPEESVAKVDIRHPSVVWDGLEYGNWKDQREENIILDVPETVRSHNGSWWMDILLVKGGGNTPVDKAPGDVVGYRKELTRWMPKRIVRKEKRLLAKGGEADEEPEEDEPVATQRPTVAYWSKNLTLTTVADGGEIQMQNIPPHSLPFYQIGPNNTQGRTYYPPVYTNDFWLLKENLIEINDTVTKLPLRVTYHAISTMKLHIFSSLTVGFEQASQQQGGGAEMDEIKRMLTETNPLLLITTAIVTILHMVFEFLAFSNDVSHWRKKDKDGDLTGISLRSIITNCVTQLVILLYLYDSSEETSWMILFTQGTGLLIEAWKITKVADVRIRPSPGSIIGYTITFEDKHQLSEDEKKTQEYDREAFRLVSYFAFPVLIIYAGYRLYAHTHRSWWSYIITTLAQAIYLFGFAQLIPQLIINYKLKSVAHIPMKAMVYKTLSTVVDDFFAFCIKMPWLHRLACFRDDAVFVVLLIQKYMYRTDYTRANEYGQVSEEKAKEQKESSKLKDNVNTIETEDSMDTQAGKGGKASKNKGKGKGAKDPESKKNK